MQLVCFAGALSSPFKWKPKAPKPPRLPLIWHMPTFFAGLQTTNPAPGSWSGSTIRDFPPGLLHADHAAFGCIRVKRAGTQPRPTLCMPVVNMLLPQASKPWKKAVRNKQPVFVSFFQKNLVLAGNVVLVLLVFSCFIRTWTRTTRKQPVLKRKTKQNIYFGTNTPKNNVRKRQSCKTMLLPVQNRFFFFFPPGHLFLFVCLVAHGTHLMYSIKAADSTVKQENGLFTSTPGYRLSHYAQSAESAWLLGFLLSWLLGFLVVGLLARLLARLATGRCTRHHSIGAHQQKQLNFWKPTAEWSLCNNPNTSRKLLLP